MPLISFEKQGVKLSQKLRDASYYYEAVS